MPSHSFAAVLLTDTLAPPCPLDLDGFLLLCRPPSTASAHSLSPFAASACCTVFFFLCAARSLFFQLPARHSGVHERWKCLDITADKRTAIECHETAQAIRRMLPANTKNTKGPTTYTQFSSNDNRICCRNGCRKGPFVVIALQVSGKPEKKSLVAQKISRFFQHGSTPIYCLGDNLLFILIRAYFNECKIYATFPTVTSHVESETGALFCH